MVAYHYPPEGGSSGVLRTLKFSKYLPKHGWLPHVLTLRDNFYRVQDRGLLQDIPPEAVIHRTFALDSSRHLAIKGRHFALFTVPDPFVTWLPFGVAQGIKVIRQWPIRSLYSTSPSPTAHLIAGCLKKLTSLPWIADFRDPWIEKDLYPTPGSLRFRVESVLEKWVIRNADYLTVTTPQLRDEFLERHPDISLNKIKVIFNGYDESDFQSVESLRQTDCFEIIHAGLVTEEFRNPFPLLRVLSSLINSHQIPKEKISMTFLGGGEYIRSKKFNQNIKQLGLENIVHVEGRVPNAEALQRMARAAALLLLQASEDTRTLIPAKAFEYLRMNKPILAITGEGATADLLREMGECFVAAPQDEDTLKRAVEKIYLQWSQGVKSDNGSRSIKQFERSHLTRDLANVLECLK